MVLMNVDYNTGNVTAARMLVSTGNTRFDDAALAAFRKWRFKPHTKSPVKTPITFVQHGSGH
jgi:TonB family protein